MQKIFHETTKKRLSQEKQTSFTTALLNLQKKHSQTAKGSTMFPEWWTIQDSNL